MRSIAHRVQWLETEGQPPENAVIIIWRHADETEAKARSRWCLEHSGRDPDRPGARVLMVSWLDKGERS
jgi:hypothetical protein